MVNVVDMIRFCALNNEVICVFSDRSELIIV